MQLTYDVVKEELKKLINSYVKEDKKKETIEQLPAHRRPQIQFLEIAMGLLDKDSSNKKADVLMAFVYIIASPAITTKGKLQEGLNKLIDLENVSDYEKACMIHRATKFYNDHVFEKDKTLTVRVTQSPFATIKDFPIEDFEKCMANLPANLLDQTYESSRPKEPGVFSLFAYSFSLWSTPKNPSFKTEIISNKEIIEDKTFSL
jgi:hypothetical protein